MARRSVKRTPARTRVDPIGSLLGSGGTILLGVLVFVTIQLIRHPPERREEPAKPRPDWQASFQQRVDGVTWSIEAGPVDVGAATVRPQGSGAVHWHHRQYEVEVRADEARELRAQLRAVHAPAEGIAVSFDEQADSLRGRIGVDGLLTHTVVARWSAEPPEPGRVAIIIDDLGNDMLVARTLVTLDVPVAFAVMPFRTFSREIAELARLFGREVLLHLPMEAESGATFGARGVLRADMPQDEILAELEESLAAVPNVIGVNNHMGSRFTQDRERMLWVLQRLKQHELFFVDSLTSSHTAGREVAAGLGLPYLPRHVFLDDPPDEATVQRRLAELLALGRRQGLALGIGHPHAVTVAALKDLGALAREQGVEVVPVSALVEAAAQADVRRAARTGDDDAAVAAPSAPR